MSNDTFYLTFKHRDVFSEVCEKWDEILSDLPWDILFLKVFSVLPNFVFLLFREQPIFTCKAHVFHIDPKTKRSWLPASSAAVNVSFFYDSSRALYRIISVEGTKVHQNTVKRTWKCSKQIYDCRLSLTPLLLQIWLLPKLHKNLASGRTCVPIQFTG